MAQISMDSFDAYLKEWYIEEKNLFTADAYKNKLLSSIKKDPTASGDLWNISVAAGSIVGDAATYSTARTNATAGTDVKFYGAYKDRFGFGFLDDKLLKAARDTKGSVKPAITKMDQVRDQFARSTNYQLYRSEDGSIARLNTDTPAISGNTLTLNFDDNSKKPAAQRIRPGMILQVAGTKTGAVRTGTWTVSEVGQTTCTVTGSSGATVPSAQDYVFVEGDAQNGGSAISLAGLESWVPLAEADVGTFKGVNRATDKRALGGIRVSATAATINEAFIDAGDEARRYGAAPGIIFTHSSRLSQLKKELSGQVRYTNVAGRAAVKLDGKQAAKFGFPAMMLEGDEKGLLVVDDWACPYNVSWMLDLDSIVLRSLTPWGHLRNADSLRMLRQTDGNNGYEFNLAGYGELLIYAPGNQTAIIHAT